jgi:hypothetical protein
LIFAIRDIVVTQNQHVSTIQATTTESMVVLNGNVHDTYYLNSHWIKVPKHKHQTQHKTDISTSINNTRGNDIIQRNQKCQNHVRQGQVSNTKTHLKCRDFNNVLLLHNNWVN